MIKQKPPKQTGNLSYGQIIIQKKGSDIYKSLWGWRNILSNSPIFRCATIELHYTRWAVLGNPNRSAILLYI